jgi:hypothetical protein
MPAAFEIRSRLDVGREQWDQFVDESDEAWLWHRWDMVEALALWPGYKDASFALTDGQGRLLALMPLHCVTTRLAGVMPLVRLMSLGGPACAPAPARKKVLLELHDRILQLMADNNAVASEVRVAALTPWLQASGAPKVNPLIVAGFENTQTETWTVDLNDTPEQIRRRYSELTRRELRKVSQSELRLREAAGTKDLEIYYRLHLETYARTGARPHPVAYFQAIFEKFQPRGLARILFAERKGAVVAAQNTGRYKAGAIYWTGASVSNKEGGENRMLFDAQIIAARAEGFRCYETGQAFINSSNAKDRGLSRFKQSFGADLQPYYRGVLYSQRLSVRFMRGLRSMAQTVWNSRP